MRSVLQCGILFTLVPGHCVTDTIPSDTTAMEFFHTRLLSKVPIPNYVTSRHQRLVLFCYIIVLLGVNVAIYSILAIEKVVTVNYKIRIMFMRNAKSH